MLLAKIGLSNYPIKTSPKNQLIEHFINSIARRINFNLNVIFRIKITKN